MGLLQTIATDGAASMPRWLQAVRFMAKHPVRTARLLRTHRWSERTVILLVMQSLDNSITTFTKKGVFGRRYTSKQGHGEPNPAFIPAGYEANQLAAKHIDGIAGGTWGEIFNVPLTAHFIGGCAIGSSVEDGVIDAYHRVHGYPGLSVVDGSAISANLGVNPSLTITAQAERAFSFWPNKGDADPRPAAGYERLAPVPPRDPAVPSGAPAELR
jgi:cholesterol oxidase